MEHQLIEAWWGPSAFREAWWWPRGRWLNSWHSSRYLCDVTSAVETEDRATCLTVIFQGSGSWIQGAESSLLLACTRLQLLPAPISFVLLVSRLFTVLFSSALTFSSFPVPNFFYSLFCSMVYNISTFQRAKRRWGSVKILRLKVTFAFCLFLLVKIRVCVCFKKIFEKICLTKCLTSGCPIVSMQIKVFLVTEVVV